MSSELFSLTPAVTPDRPTGGYGSSNATKPALQPAQAETTKVANTQTAATSTSAAAETSHKPNLASGQRTQDIKQNQGAKEAQKLQQLQNISEDLEEKSETSESMSAKELRETLDEINSALYSYNRSLRFELHEDTEDLVVKVFNTKTDEVIRQYPSEEVLQRKAKLLEGSTSFFSTQIS